MEEIRVEIQLPPKQVRDTMVELDHIMIELTRHARHKDGDWEVAHAVADHALLTMIELLQPLLHSDLKFSLDHIKAAYLEVGKWYS